MLLASSGWRLGTLLKTLKCTEHDTHTRVQDDPAQDVNSAEAVKQIQK